MPVRDTSVKYFHSSMTGLAGCSYSAGQVIAQLDLILVNGFNSQSVSTIVVSSGIATVTTSAAHGFTMISTDIGPVITIAGATPSGLNREWRIEEVTDTDEFTIDVTGVVTDGSASGTITVKQSSLGWQTLYTGTNKRVYSRADSNALASVLQVLETSNAYYAVFNAGESATNVDTLVSSWGAKNYIKTGTTSTSTYHPWHAVGNSLGFYIMNALAATEASVNCVAGFFDLLAGDHSEVAGTHCILKGTSATSGTDTSAVQNAASNARIMRSYNAASPDGGQDISTTTHGKSPTYWGQVGTRALPDPVSGKVHLAVPEAWEVTVNVPRGWYPGIFDVLHDDANVTHKSIVTGGGPSANKDYMLLKWGASASLAIDVTGPWE